MSFCGLPSGPLGPGTRAAILGVPFDCGLHPDRIGSREGPAAVRRASRWLRRFPATGSEDAARGVIDAGDVALVPGRPARAFPAIEEAAARLHAAGVVPIGIGGDGAISLPLLRAAARFHPGLCVIHVDAHTDAYLVDPEEPLNPATQFSHAASEGILDAEHSWHVGTRGFTYEAGVIARTEALGYRVVTTANLVARGFAQTAAEIRETIGDRPAYLCWDMDIFDPSVAPGVCTPAWGGLSAREGIELLHALRGPRYVAMDFNTVSPPHDVAEAAAQLCGHMILEAVSLLDRNAR